MSGGVWISRTTGTVSYPETGHAHCFSVEDESIWFRHRSDCILSLLRRFPPRGLLLDVGGGNGHVARRLRDAGHDAILLEPGPDGARTAAVHRGIPDVICASLDGAGILPSSFGAASIFDVIEHVEAEGPFLQQLHEILEPGGLLYGTVPAHPWLWSGADVSAGHFRRYSLGSLRAMLADRFELLFATHLFAPFVLPLLVARTIPHRLGIRGAVLSSESEHGVRGGVLVEFLRSRLRRELSRLEALRPRRVGTSILFVARRR